MLLSTISNIILKKVVDFFGTYLIYFVFLLLQNINFMLMLGIIADGPLSFLLPLVPVVFICLLVWILVEIIRFLRRH